MFVKNDKLRQGCFSNDVLIQLPEAQRKKAVNSIEASFHDEVFLEIDEDLFSHLYSDVASRPNTPVNYLVASLILRTLKGWTFAELFRDLDFNILTRMALGIYDFEVVPFSEVTIFNFQNRLHTHFIDTGENLIATVYNQLTKQQIKKYKVKTGIQRTDSFQLMSNIAKYSRLRLIIEVLRRLCRILSEEDRESIDEKLGPYIKASSSEKCCYELNDEQLPNKLIELAEIYHKLYKTLPEIVKGNPEFKIFERIYLEQFSLDDKGEIYVKANTELNSSCLQAPDDLDATYRNKRKKSYKGQVANVTETANPENELNLITDIRVENNNVNDNTILAGAIDEMKAKTPELNEIHADGAYGGVDSDKKALDNEITLVATASTGKKAEVPIECSENEDGSYQVSCPTQTVIATNTTKRYKATFDLEHCQSCPFREQCKVKMTKKGRVYYFTPETVRAHMRARNILKVPPERRKIRPNVEATVKEFTRGFNHVGKLNVRGSFKAELYAFTAGIGINLGRIHRNVA